MSVLIPYRRDILYIYIYTDSLVTVCETEEDQQKKLNRKFKCHASGMPAYRVREHNKETSKMNEMKENKNHRIQRTQGLQKGIYSRKMKTGVRGQNNIYL